MLINQIEPINEAAINLLEDDTTNIIDKIIELPLRKACKIFKEKGIETVMSSANKNNVLKSGEKTIEKDLTSKCDTQTSGLFCFQKNFPFFRNRPIIPLAATPVAQPVTRPTTMRMAM